MRVRPLTPLLFCALFGSTPLGAQGLQAPALEQPHECDDVEVTAGSMLCDNEVCDATGLVSLQCNTLRLWADRALIHLGPERQFAGAQAMGNVIVVEENTLLRCSQMWLDPDRIRGRVKGAELSLKAVGQVNKGDHPVGPSLATIWGDLERPDKEHLHVSDGRFTLCDCGDEPPSWSLRGPSVDATLGERAVIWWPQLYIRPFGIATLPVTPPLLPLSIPLERRAAGLLAPTIAFYDGFNWPTLDLPFFMPLGESWDLTLAPGLRIPWGTHKGLPKDLGAPRLGTRLRYAPLAEVSGELRTQWTFDPHHFAVRRLLTLDPTQLPVGAKANAPCADIQRAGGDDPNGVIVSDAYFSHCQLVHRLQLDWEHRVDFMNDLTWLTDLEWVSDDLIRSEFRANYAQPIIDSVPSRSQVLWREAGFTGLAAVDFLMDAGPNAPENYSNVRGSALHTAHRGPALDLQLHPVTLADGVHAGGGARFVRYGPWGTHEKPLQLVTGAGAGLDLARDLGPVRVRAGGGLDALVVGAETPAPSTWKQGVAFLRADADTTLAGSLGDYLHTITPRAAYRAIAWRIGDKAGIEDGFDPYLQREGFHQAELALDQSLWKRSSGQLRRLLRLTLTQPWAIRRGDLAQTLANLFWSTPYASGNFVASLDWPCKQKLRELRGSVSVPVGPLSLSSTYVLAANDADRFRRTVYSLAAPPPQPGDPQCIAEDASRAEQENKATGANGAVAELWTNSLSGGIQVRPSETFSFAYAASFLMPVPGREGSLPSCEEVLARDVARDAPTFAQQLEDNEAAVLANPPQASCRPRGGLKPHNTSHALSLSYLSPCRCWGLTLAAGLPYMANVPLQERLSMSVSLTIGDYNLGMQ